MQTEQAVPSVTTQDAFHSMRGHVRDGQQVKCRDGSTLIIKNVIEGRHCGYRVYRGNESIGPLCLSAFEVTDQVVNA